jgi:hypothetical protein
MRHRPDLLAAAVAAALLLGCGPARATVVHADSGDFVFDTVTAVDDPPGGLPPGAVPAATRLAAISPNPFNPSTTIAFELAAAGPVELAIFDLGGRLVDVIAAGDRPAGRHQAVWNGRNRAGLAVPSGTYVCRLVAAGQTQTMKLVLAK